MDYSNIEMSDLQQIFFIRFGLSAVVYTPVPLITGSICLRDDIPCYAKSLPVSSNKQLNCCQYFSADEGDLMSTKGLPLKYVKSKKALKGRLVR